MAQAEVPVHPRLVQAATELSRECFNRKDLLTPADAESVGKVFKTIYRAMTEAIGDRVRPRNLSEAIDIAFDLSKEVGVAFSPETKREKSDDLKIAEQLAEDMRKREKVLRKKLKTKALPPTRADAKRNKLRSRKKKVANG
jgi:hypothetical protein